MLVHFRRHDDAALTKKRFLNCEAKRQAPTSKKKGLVVYRLMMLAAQDFLDKQSALLVVCPGKCLEGRLASTPPSQTKHSDHE